MKRKDISGLKVNKTRCATCPFNENGNREIRQTVESRALQVSQMCHHTNNTTLCRGSRDLQLELMYRLGVLKEPTDTCWDETWEKLKKA